jgi:polygalacturonase
LNDDHRTEVTLDSVRIDGITPQQVHGHFATVTIGPMGANVDFSATDIKVVKMPPAPASSGSAEPAFSCEGLFVPMQ